MYDLRLTEEQLAIRDTVRDFVAQGVFPVATRPDRLEPFDVPLAMDLVDAAAELGLRTLALSEEAGGAGADTLTCCIVAEELAAGDVDVAAVLARTSALGGVLFNRLMSEEQRKRFLPDFLDDNRYHLALADREADSETALGIDYHRETGNRLSVETTATKSGNGHGDWIVNGAKTRIANAPLAKLFAVLVDADGENRVLLVPADTAGVSITEVGRDGGWYVGSCGDVAFTNCRVPAGNMLGAEAIEALTGPGCDFGLPQAQAINLGVGRAAFEAALDYAGIRVQGGRRIVEHQAIGAKLADVVISLETVRNAIWQAAWAADNPGAEPNGNFAPLPRAKIAQVVTAERIYRATKDSAECFGAMGVMRDMPLQKYIHVSRVFLHTGDGTGDSRLRIAESLAGFSRS
jgi:alkylation response protein AidB-like acyl-CoA dehydrogenase